MQLKSEFLIKNTQNANILMTIISLYLSFNSITIYYKDKFKILLIYFVLNFSLFL